MLWPNARHVLIACVAIGISLGGCAWKSTSGYGVGADIENEQARQAAAERTPPPDTPGMYLGLIERMQAQGLYYASLAHLDAFEKQYGAQPRTILLRADALRQTGQPTTAVQTYRRLVDTPLAAQGWHGIGLIAGASGDFAGAVQALGEAARLDPTDANTLSDLGYARMRAGDVPGARVALMKAAELDQRNPKIISNLVLFLLADGKHVQANGLMNEQRLSPAVRAAIRKDAAAIDAARRARAAGDARAGAGMAGSNASSAAEADNGRAGQAGGSHALPDGMRARLLPQPFSP
jgi:Flp pilus assembly protein TadD